MILKHFLHVYNHCFYLRSKHNSDDIVVSQSSATKETVLDQCSLDVVLKISKSKMESHILHDLHKNLTLIDKYGSSQTLSKYDTVLLYFSAHWCPPCRQFTPRLKELYEKIPKGSVKIVFVSWDNSRDEFTSYFHNEHGDWIAVSFDTDREEIGHLYGVKGIPALLLIDNKTAASCLNQDMLRNQVANPSTHDLDVVLGWEKACGSPYRLRFGSEVLILFLKSKPEINGKKGKVVGWKEDRIIIKTSDETEIAIKRKNLFPIGIKDKQSEKYVISPCDENRTSYSLSDKDSGEETKNVTDLEFPSGTPVILKNLSTTKWNDQSGELQSSLEDGKYLVYMNSREILKIKHSNIFI